LSERKLAYEKEDRGYVVRAWYGASPGDPASIEIRKGDEVVREFQYAAYRIWNIAAHFDEIVDDLMVTR
jgi:hypothetical protein